MKNIKDFTEEEINDMIYSYTTTPIQKVKDTYEISDTELAELTMKYNPLYPFNGVLYWVNFKGKLTRIDSQTKEPEDSGLDKDEHKKQ